MKKPEEIIAALDALTAEMHDFVCRQLTGTELRHLGDDNDRMEIIERAEAIIEAWQHGGEFKAQNITDAAGLMAMLKVYSGLVAELVLCEDAKIKDQVKAYPKLH